MRTRHRTAFATYTAIILMLLIATTLVSAGMMFGADARRTRSQREEAQVRQLLTAGALVARSQVGHATQSPTTRPTDVALPAELTGKLTITLTPQDDNDVTAVIHAEHGQRRMEQTVRFQRDSGMWHMVSATLESP